MRLAAELCLQLRFVLFFKDSFSDYLCDRVHKVIPENNSKKMIFSFHFMVSSALGTTEPRLLGSVTVFKSKVLHSLT